MKQNTEHVFLESLSSTADRASAVLDNKNYVAGHFVVNVTSRASTDAGPVVSVQGVVPGTTGTFYTLLTTTTIGGGSTSTSLTHVVHVAPWVSTAANNREALALPHRLRVSATYASTADITYSVGASLS